MPTRRKKYTDTLLKIIGRLVKSPLCRVDMDLNHMAQGGSSMPTVGFPFKDGLAQ